MLGKYKSKVLAGLLSLFMVLGVIISPLAGAAEADDTPEETTGNIDIDVPRNDNDALEDAKPRQFRYFRVSENEYTQDELNELYRKVDAMAMDDVIKEYGEGELSEYSKVTEVDGLTYDSFQLRGLPTGAYILKETEESAADHQYKMVAIAWNSQKGVNETSKVVDKVFTTKKPLILNKIAIDTESENEKVLKLQGVKFKLIDLDNEENPVVKLYETDQKGVYSYAGENKEPVEELVTNADGQIFVNDLPEGNYKFTEIATIEDYVILAGEEDTEEFLYKPSIGKELDKQNSKNPEKGTPNRLHLIKVDGDDDKPLAGVEFKLYVNVGDVSYPVGVDVNGEYYIEDKEENKVEDINYIFKTDDQGNIILSDLPELPENGRYEFREVKTLDGYVLIDDKTHPAEFGKTVRVKNFKNPTPIDIKLTKVDSYNGKPLDKVGFELFRVKVKENENGTLENVTERVGLSGEAGNYQFDETAAQSSLTFQLYTNTNGEINVSNLPDGDYYFKENEPLKEYDTDENRGQESLKLNRENNTFEMKNKNPNIFPPDSDRKGKGGFRFIKVDDSKDKNRLAGATFALYSVNEKGENVPYEVGGKRVTLKSGSNGEFEVKNLPVGKYILRETAAPNGYTLNVNPIEFTVTNKSYNEDAIMIENKKNPDKTVTPPVVRPPSRTNTPSTPRTVTPPKTYYVPKDKPGVPRGPLVKTGDIRIVILVGLGLLMIIGGSIIVKKDEKNQKIRLA